MNKSMMRLDGSGGATRLKEVKVDESGIFWMQLNLDFAKTFLKSERLAKGIALDFLTAEESRPRALLVQDQLLLNFRGVNANPDSDPEDMVSVRLLLTENLIITVTRRKLDSLDEIAAMLKADHGPKNSADFMVFLLRNMVEQATEAVSEIEDNLDVVEDKLESDASSINKQEISDLKRSIVFLRRYLIPQRDAILRLLSDQPTWVGSNVSSKLREVCDSNIRVVEDLDACKERTNILHEVMLNIGQERINQKMYVLSIVAVIFMPLSFLTGLFGVNLGGIPGNEYKFGFLIMCLVLRMHFGQSFLSWTNRKSSVCR